MPGDLLKDWGLPKDIDPKYAGSIVAVHEELAALRLRKLVLTNAIENAELLLIRQLQAAGYEGDVTGLTSEELAPYDSD